MGQTITFFLKEMLNVFFLNWKTGNECEWTMLIYIAAIRDIRI